MKRSHMLRKLEAHLLRIRAVRLQNEADEILRFLEQEGMVPPEIETEFYDRANCDYHKAHEWETE